MGGNGRKIRDKNCMSTVISAVSCHQGQRWVASLLLLYGHVSVKAGRLQCLQSYSEKILPFKRLKQNNHNISSMAKTQPTSALSSSKVALQLFFLCGLIRLGIVWMPWWALMWQCRWWKAYCSPTATTWETQNSVTYLLVLMKRLQPQNLHSYLKSICSLCLDCMCI